MWIHNISLTLTHNIRHTKISARLVFRTHHSYMVEVKISQMYFKIQAQSNTARISGTRRGMTTQHFPKVPGKLNTHI